MEVPSFPAVVTVACVLLTAFLLYGRLRRRLPPGPRWWPFVGNAHTVAPVRFRCFAEWTKRYGPVMSVWLGPKLNVVVSTPELAREVLKEKDQQLADRPRNRVNAEFSRGGQDLIWADYGPHYVKVRKVCTLHLFSPRSLEALRPIREDEVTAVVETIYRDCVDPEKGGKSLAVRNYLGAVAFNNITRLVLGKRFMSADGVVDAQGRELKAINAKEGKLRVSPSIADYVPCLRWLFPVDEAAFAENAARRDRLTKTLMAEHAIRLRQQNGGQPKQHLVDALLTLQKEYDLTDDTISGLLWDMITAGIDTATISVEWAMAELIRNPRVQSKAQEELDRVVGPDRIMTEADFPNLPYLRWVTKEALRLHPPTPLMLPHKANTDVKLGGYDVPKGSTVLVNVWAIARDPAVWKDPLEFQPERFEEEDMDMKGHDFRLLPFGAGRRVCPGAQLGIYMVQSILGHLLHQFRWELPQGVRPEDMDMSEKPGLVTYMHSPLQAVATPRLEATHLYKRVLFEMC